MENEQDLRDLTDEIVSIIEIPEEYIPEHYDDIMSMIEQAVKANDFDALRSDLMIPGYADGEQIGDVYKAWQRSLLTESEKDANMDNRLTEDYEAKYAKGNDGPWAAIYSAASGPATTSANTKPAVKGTPHFEFNDGGDGPIPTTGLGRKDYEAVYSKSGSLTETKKEKKGESSEEKKPKPVKKAVKPEAKREAARRPSFISPALQEALDSRSITKQLVESKCIDVNDLDLLQEASDDKVGVSNVRRDLQDFYRKARDLEENFPGQYQEINGDPVEHILAIIDAFDTDEDHEFDYVVEQLARLDDAIGFTIFDLGQELAEADQNGDEVGISNMEPFFEALRDFDEEIVDYIR